MGVHKKGFCARVECKNHTEESDIAGLGLCQSCYRKVLRGTLEYTPPTEVRTCALEGCNQTFEVFATDTTKRFCSELHRNRGRDRRVSQRYAENKGTALARNPGHLASGCWTLANDPWAGDLHSFGAFGLPVPMSTSVQPWGMA